jgi:hypothetical protein
MKRSRTATVAIIAVLGALVVTNAHAGKECSEATLQGAYGFQVNGISPAGEQLAVVGLTTFDGLGGWHSDNTNKVDGVISRSSVKGTYVVSSDCTGYMLDDSELVFQQIVIVDGGNEMRSLASMTDAPPNAHWTGLYKKQRVEDCTAVTLGGAWGYSFQGSLRVSDPPQPATVVGRGTFDNAGYFDATEWRVVGDEFITRSFNTPYTVSSDCTGTTAGSYFVLVGDGSEAFGIATTRNYPDIGILKRQ